MNTTQINRAKLLEAMVQGEMSQAAVKLMRYVLMDLDVAEGLLKSVRNNYGQCDCDSTPGPLGFEPCDWCRIDQYLKAPDQCCLRDHNHDGDCDIHRRRP